MKNIHVLPTENYKEDYKLQNSDAVIQVVKLGQLIFDSSLKEFRINKNKSWAASCDTDVLIPHNIYITSDEEIKEGDLIIYKNGDEYYFAEYRLGYYDRYELCKKIILTTDQDLIKDGVQAIDDEFLEWFVKHPNCEEVKIIYGLFNTMGRQVDPMNLGQNHSQCVWKYKIIIPKEEPTFENSIDNTMNIMSIANSMFGKKEEPKQDYTALLKQVGIKQETLEEAAERFIKKQNFNSLEIDDKIFEAILFGAKWQAEPEQFFNDDRVKTLEKGIEYLLKKQERMYSKEEVIQLLIKFNQEITEVEDVREWFEQFKKK